MQLAWMEKMREEGRDKYDLGKFRLVAQESLGMIPDCHRRLVAAHNDLTALLESFSADLNLEEGDVEEEEEQSKEYQQYVAAMQELKLAQEIIDYTVE